MAQANKWQGRSETGHDTLSHAFDLLKIDPRSSKLMLLWLVVTVGSAAQSASGPVAALAVATIQASESWYFSAFPIWSGKGQELHQQLLLSVTPGITGPGHHGC